jgi:hypothetical protein
MGQTRGLLADWLAGLLGLLACWLVLLTALTVLADFAG